MDSAPIRIRPAALADAPVLLDLYAPYVEHTAITFEYDVPSLQEFSRRMEAVLRRYPYLTAESGGTPVGYAYASPFHERAAYGWAVETSIYVSQSVRGQGVGGALYQALERVLARQHILNLNACIAVPPPEGDPYLTGDSAAFHSHLGYRPVGRFHQCGYKFGRWYDMIWMEKLLAPHPERPEAVVPFPELLERGEVSQLLL